MDLLSFWLGTKVAKGEGKSAFLILGIIFFVFLFLAAVFLADSILGVFLAAVLMIVFGIAYFSRRKKDR